MRIGCFECTGCLISWLPNEIHDIKIRPQGMPKESFTAVPTHQQRNETQSHETGVEPEGQDEEEAALDEERRYLEEEETEEGECEMENENDFDNTINGD